MKRSVTIISNNGEVGGGEVMMVALARAIRTLGLDVQVAVPAEPDSAARLVGDAGFDVIVVPGSDRRTYLSGIAHAKGRFGGDLWWCNGLVPALATAGSRHRRVLQLHQLPVGLHRGAWAVARRGVERTFVPSRAMASHLPGATVLTNWTDALSRSDPKPAQNGLTRVGFIGRFSPIKGLDVLARAMHRLDQRTSHATTLVLAGDARFVSPADAASVETEIGKVADVERLGWVSRETFFDQVDLVVVPSVCEESFGLVAAEAMAAGRPVIVSDAGALPEVVGPTHPWITRAGDAADTAEVIGRVLELDPEARTTVCDVARLRWEAEFAPKAGELRVAEALGGLGLLPTDRVVRASVDT